VRRSVSSFLDAFAKLRKSTISFVMSANCLVSPSVPPAGTIRLLLDEFLRDFLLEFFRESVEISQVSFKCDKNYEYFT